jgi:hypothetical protein
VTVVRCSCRSHLTKYPRPKILWSVHCSRGGSSPRGQLWAWLQGRAQGEARAAATAFGHCRHCPAPARPQTPHQPREDPRRCRWNWSRRRAGAGGTQRRALGGGCVWHLPGGGAAQPGAGPVGCPRGKRWVCGEQLGLVAGLGECFVGRIVCLHGALPAFGPLVHVALSAPAPKLPPPHPSRYVYWLCSSCCRSHAAALGALPSYPPLQRQPWWGYRGGWTVQGSAARPSGLPHLLPGPGVSLLRPDLPQVGNVMSRVAFAAAKNGLASVCLCFDVARPSLPGCTMLWR